MAMLNTKQIIAHSGVQFGTSGARGLVTQFTPEVCAAFTHAFLHSLSDRFEFKQVAIAIDNRPSSPEMAKACITAIENQGLEAIYYGVIPTPALAYSAMQDDIPCIMVTGSHIPFDRNGLKFYRPDGEITKVDEQVILNSEVDFDSDLTLCELSIETKAAQQYVERYTDLFEITMLQGKRIGIYEHSSAGRDLYQGLFEALGAEVIPLERTDEFVPIDTEAVAETDKVKARAWSEEFDLDFIFSTDGDGDRPLVADEDGEWLRGDVLGLLCAQEIGSAALAIPVSCNSMIDENQGFDEVRRTKIGSPYVIAEFDLLSEYKNVSGFEANGGYLLASDVMWQGKKIAALPTRDALLPAIMLLSASRKLGSIKTLVDSLPKRFTCSDRIQNFATESSRKLICEGLISPTDLLTILGLAGEVIESINTVDGLRLTLANQDIVHLRPSGNAPELRCYAESASMERAELLVRTALNNVSLNTLN